jgi:hypothetical protein
METKVCFKCGINKPLTDYYVHKKMGDGHLGKCKECAKLDVKNKYVENIQSEEYVEKERARGREKYKRLNYVERTQYKKPYSRSTRSIHRHLKAYGYCIVDKEYHHWNYLFKYDVFILNKRAHKLVHKYMNYNELLNCFVTNENEILDTKQKHYDFIIKVFKQNLVNYEIEQHNE